MPRLYIRIANGIAKPLRTTPTEGPFIFGYSFPPFSQPLDTTIDQPGDRISTEGSVEASDRLVSDLQTRPNGEAASDVIQEELQGLARPLSDAQRWVLSIVRQTIDSPDRHVLTSDPVWWWSIDGNTWQERNDPGTIHITRVKGRSLPHLDARSARQIQQLLAQQEEPLLALDFFYAAERLDEDPYSWVLATIAAELGVKEVLIRLEPKLGTLLLEMPSPPMHKLYGRILKEVTGQDFEYTSDLQKGAETRNAIVHRPRHTLLDPQKVVDYLGTVHKALRSLVAMAREVRSRRVTSA